MNFELNGNCIYVNEDETIDIVTDDVTFKTSFEELQIIVGTIDNYR